MSALHRTLIVLAAALAVTFAFNAPARAEDDAPAKKTAIETIGIGKVKVNPSVRKDTSDADRIADLDQVVEAMDSQLLDCFHSSRKFELVTRSDLDEVMKEQTLVGSGNVDTDDAAASKAFALKGCKYLVVTTVDAYQHYQEVAHFEEMGETAAKQVVQFSVVAKLIDTTSGKIRETANFRLTNKDISRVAGHVESKGKLVDEMARMMSDRVANRMVDVLFPAKIVAVTAGVVTINRGDGTYVMPGQRWDVFELGEELIDPDTKESLGSEEVQIGQIEITNVQPKFSKGRIIDGSGMKVGHVLRPSAERPDANHVRGAGENTER